MTRLSRRVLWIGAAVVAVALLVLAWAQLSPWPRTGVTFTAKQLCSCLFVTGRSEASCRGDFGGYVNRFDVRVDRSGLPATARVESRLAFWRGESVYEAGYGCRIVR